jgi:hypothetical protein
MHDLLFTDVIEKFDQGSEAVSMRRYDYALALKYGGSDRIFPIRKETMDCILKTLPQRNQMFGEPRVARVFTGITIIIFSQERGPYVVAPSPKHDLIFSVLLGRFCLIQSLEGPIMTLI